MLNKLKEYIFENANIESKENDFVFISEQGNCELSFYLTKKRFIYQFQVCYNNSFVFNQIIPKSENIFVDLTIENCITVSLSDSKYTIESDREYFAEFAKICRELFQ